MYTSSPDVGVAHVHRQAVGVLGDVARLVDIADVQLRVDALGEQVQRQVHDVDVARALAVAEERALDAVGAGEDAEFGRGDAGAAVVVRVQREHDAVATIHVAQEPLDRVGVEVRRVHLDRGRQVQDQRALRRRIDHVDHRVADLERVVELGAGEALGRVLVEELGRRATSTRGCGRTPRRRSRSSGSPPCRGRTRRGAAASTIEL